MIKNKNVIALLAVLLLSAVGLKAQEMRTAYFLEGYSYRYKMNPAFASSRGYFSFPALGQLKVGLESNLGMNSLLYPTGNGQLTTLFNQSVSIAQMEAAIKDKNQISVNVSTPVLSFGWWAKKTFHTIDLSVRAVADATLPGDLFRFIKGAPSGNADMPDVYDLSSLGARADAFIELGYGLQRDVNKNIHLGGRVKFLVGAARGQISADKFKVEALADRWSIDSKVNFDLSQVVQLGIDENNYPTFGFDPNELLVNTGQKISYGAAFDFGLSVDFLKYLSFSASVLDLGFMVTPKMTRISTSGEPWIYTGLPDKIDVNGGGDLNGQLNTIMESIQTVYKFTDRTELNKKTDMLAMTVNAGLEFRMPFWQRLTVGALSSTHINGKHHWTEGRFSLNMNATKWLGLTANYGISNFGESAGAALSIHAPGFNLVVATDSFLPFTELNPQYIPIGKLNTSVSVGINFLFGKYHGKLLSRKEKRELQPLAPKPEKRSKKDRK